MPAISIIIPVFNTETYLEQCVSSLYNQGLKSEDFEVILVDDGSTDNSLKLSKVIAERFGNIRVFHQRNQGQAIARNKGLDVALGKYIVFVDSDDYMIEMGLKNLYDIISTSNLDIVYGYWYEENKFGEIISKKQEKLKNNTIYSGEELILKYSVFGSVCACIFRKEIFDKERFQPGITHEDSDLCFRIYPFLSKVMFIDVPVYFYRYNHTSTDRSLDKEKLLKNIESDMIIASRVQNFTQKNVLNKKIRTKYIRIANSMMIGYLLRLRNLKIVTEDSFKSRLIQWRERGVYPIKGRCDSLLSSVTSKAINFPLVLKLFLTH